MTIAEKLAQIKKLVFDTAMPPQPAQQPAPAGKSAKPYKLQDGTPVSISQLATGGDVLINGSPANAGNYTLQDGTQITVDNSSKITAVMPAKAQAGDNPAPATDGLDGGDNATLAEAFKAVKQQVANQQQAFEAYKAETAKQLADHAAKMNKHQDALQQMFELMQKVAKTPTGNAPEAPKAKFSFGKVNDRKEMMNRYLHAMDELKTTGKVN